MGKSYSLDLRELVYGLISAGKARRAAARHCQVSPSFAVKLAARVASTGSLRPARQGRPPGGGKLAPYRAYLMSRVEATPDITMPELAVGLEAEHGVIVHPSSLSRFFLRQGLTFKKTLLAQESERADVRRKRHFWRTHRQPRMRLVPHRLVFLDETSTTTKMTCLRGRAPRGKRLRATAPFGHWHTQTFIAGLRCNGLTAPWLLDGPIHRLAFECYIETQLAPTLNPGDVVILDNLSSHKSLKASQCLKDRGAWFLFLPPYSPDLNPIEMAFAKLKELLRKAKARTIDALCGAIGEICSLFPDDECWNFVKAAGYAYD